MGLVNAKRSAEAGYFDGDSRPDWRLGLRSSGAANRSVRPLTCRTLPAENFGYGVWMAMVLRDLRHSVSASRVRGSASRHRLLDKARRRSRRGRPTVSSICRRAARAAAHGGQRSVARTVSFAIGARRSAGLDDTEWRPQAPSLVRRKSPTAGEAKVKGLVRQTGQVCRWPVRTRRPGNSDYGDLCHQVCAVAGRGTAAASLQISELTALPSMRGAHCPACPSYADPQGISFTQAPTERS
jgi:hypothetical protein